ncbi:NlpC/P60 family protein [Streptomyces anulatus]|uniref:C40 family peptidase n=1 Tax=Streptomyces anulatus TaxID=1892 RepID=UPI00224DC6F2|nr:NlpC/P60 family protein [Streptomyces anulatus]MCX4523930.1 NlpC/P60 family protein [Streptomyces anulatus]WSU78946.1 NlpC/P60 family protein [Streptomyces anulatus]
MKAVRKAGCLVVLLVCCAAACAAPLSSMMSAASSLGAAASGGDGGGEDLGGSAAGIPDRMLTAYKGAVRGVKKEVPKCRGMRWPVLAGIARIESNHAVGRTIAADGAITPRILGPVLNGSGAGGNTTVFADTDGGRWDGDTRFERAVGPFQFLPQTFRSMGRDGNGDGAVDPHNADDAALGAAVYLCGDGRNLRDDKQLRSALFAYNRSDAYVAEVAGWIDRYDAGATGGGGLSTAKGDARTVLDAALAQRGVPYSWGGGNASGKSRGICCSPNGQDGRQVVGFDCSGLTLYAFARAGVRLPRLAADQAGVGTRIPASAGYKALKPGDLVFYGYVPTQNSSIHHVGIYLGNGQMVNAARPGTKIRVDALSSMGGFAGGARVL